MSELGKPPYSLKILGALKFSQETLPDIRRACTDVVTTGYGYEKYTEREMLRDYEAWKEEQQRPESWEEFFDQGSGDKDVEELSARRESDRVNRDKREKLALYPDIVSWAKNEQQGIGPEAYVLVATKSEVYRLQKWGIMAQMSKEMMEGVEDTQIVEEYIKKDQLRESEKWVWLNLTLLRPELLKHVEAAERLPTWLLTKIKEEEKK